MTVKVQSLSPLARKIVVKPISSIILISSPAPDSTAIEIAAIQSPLLAANSGQTSPPAMQLAITDFLPIPTSAV
jgi:hypothetical protein